MRCRQVRRFALDEVGAKSPAVQEHLRACASCATYLQQWAKLRTGLRRVAEESAPDPSLGFARRVTRSLQDPSFAGRLTDLSLVSAGRRFVYAALTAALLLVLGLLVPASGPVRSPAAAIEPAQPEAVAAQNYPIFSGRLMDTDFEFAAPSGAGK
jgi:anti-sigma factor RsiW